MSLTSMPWVASPSCASLMSSTTSVAWIPPGESVGSPEPNVIEVGEPRRCELDGSEVHPSVQRRHRVANPTFDRTPWP